MQNRRAVSVQPPSRRRVVEPVERRYITGEEAGEGGGVYYRSPLTSQPRACDGVNDAAEL